jgi:hypothetical protein
MHQYNVSALFERTAIPKQEATMVADVLVTNFFYCFRMPKELHSNQGQSFKSRLLQMVP